MDEVAVTPLPHDSHAERVVLSGILREPGLNAAAFGELSAGDFYEYPHRLVYDAAASLWAALSPVDLVEVYRELSRRGQLAECGVNAAAWLADVYETDPTGADCVAAVWEVIGLAARRRAIMQHREALARLLAGEPVPT